MSSLRTRSIAALAAGAVLGLAAAPAGAGAARPGEAASTPVAKSASARATTAVTAAELGPQLSALMRRAGGKSSGFAIDAGTNAVLFSRSAGTGRQLASNMKLFTTATALSRLTPEGTLDTSVWRDGALSGGVVQGNLYLRGGGDPTLTAQGLRRLAAGVTAAGVTQVTGRLVFDESFFDRRRTVPQHGVRRGSVGHLSGLQFDAGRPRNPARGAATRFVDLLRKRGVVVAPKVRHGVVPELTSQQVAEVSSSPIATLIRRTNAPSNNYLAEMLLKAVAGEAGGAGSTRGGLALVRSFAAEHGAAVRGENGSGLSRRDRASAQSVGSLLDSMLDEDPLVSEAFASSLAVAGQTGTLARRMRGTAAAGRCRAKTGTLTNVSALSGYCFNGADVVVVFSFLMNGVNVNRAHTAQDRMTALLARYAP